MKKQKKLPKLNLSCETLRKLGDEKIRHIAGGATLTGACCGGTQQNSCNTLCQGC